jgi:hypothetical protein
MTDKEATTMKANTRLISEFSHRGRVNSEAGLYSDRRASMTSIRDARAAGSHEATTAAANRTAAAAAAANGPGSCTDIKNFAAAR